MNRPPLVIGHRGAAGYRPEHTLASYELAARMGADFIEPDLVSTKDHVLVARHENEIGATTDVSSHPKFADRKTTKVINGEISAGSPRTSPSWSLDLETPMVRQVRGAGLDEANAPIFIQSFELTNLVDLRQHFGVNAPLILLTAAIGAPYDLPSAGDPTTYAELTTVAGLASIRGIVNGIGPHKSQIITRNLNGTLARPTTLVADAHAAGLKVHPYTFRAENAFLPRDYRVGTDATAYGRAIDEQVRFLETGIDGLFTDQCDIAVIARAQVLATKAVA